MLEIETHLGWLRIPLQEAVKDCFDGAPVHVAEDPCINGFQALIKANGSTALFRAEGRTERCAVMFDNVPIFEADKISYCVLRLKQAA